MYLIIIPTYNEKQNIKSLIDKINEVLSNKDLFNYSILIVDDNSPDGTSNIVKKLMENYKNLFLLEREGKLGLGTAYIAGFKWGIEKGYNYFLEMDADFSHDPEYLPDMFELIKKIDFVIGSRYVKGGGIEGLGFFKKIYFYGRKFIFKANIILSNKRFYRWF